MSTFLALEGEEQVLSLCGLGDEGPGLALGTAQGVVKRINPEVLNRDSWELIRLGDGDTVVGAVELRTGTEELCFVTSDAQLLHFPAGAVRPQGRTGGGVAGVRLAPKAQVVFFGALGPEATDPVVVTVAGSAGALPGTEAGTVKVTPFRDYPGKGRATGGVRCHRFLKGEDVLQLAWIGASPAMAAADSGQPVELPAADGRRDGSGVPVPQAVTGVAAPVSVRLVP